MDDIYLRANMVIFMVKMDAERAAAGHVIENVEDYSQKVYDLVISELSRRQGTDPDNAEVYRIAKRVYRTQKPPNVRDAEEEAAFAVAATEARSGPAGGDQNQGREDSSLPFIALTSPATNPYGALDPILRTGGFGMTQDQFQQAHMLNDESGQHAFDYYDALLGMNETEARQEIFKIASISKPVATRLVTDLMRRLHIMQQILLVDLHYIHNPCQPMPFNVSYYVTLDGQQDTENSQSGQPGNSKPNSSSQDPPWLAEVFPDSASLSHDPAMHGQQSQSGKSASSTNPKRKKGDLTPSPEIKTDDNKPALKKTKAPEPVPKKARPDWRFKCCYCEKTFGLMSSLETHAEDSAIPQHGRRQFDIFDVHYERELWRATWSNGGAIQEVVGKMVLVGKGKGAVS